MMNTEINLLKNGGGRKQFQQECGRLAVYHELNFLRQNRSVENRAGLFFRAGLLMMAIGALGIGLPFIFNGFPGNFEMSNSSARVETADPDQTATTQIQSDEPARQKNYSFYSLYSLPTIKNRLTMAKIGLDMPIFKSDDENILWKGGWLFGSSPDKGGNSVIFGHRFRYLPPIANTFYNLNKIKIGDEFTIKWQGEEYNYTVIDIKTVSPDDLSIIAPSDKSIATLVTCTPLFTSNKRLAVIGKLNN